MKYYTILVQAQDFVSVDANTDEEAIEKAIELGGDSCVNWKDSVMACGRG